MERFDVVIVGAGLTGITCALELSRAGRKVCLIESSDRVGGSLKSRRIFDLNQKLDWGPAFFPMLFLSPTLSEVGVLSDLRLENNIHPYLHPTSESHALFPKSSKLRKPNVSDSKQMSFLQSLVCKPLIAPIRHPFSAISFGARVILRMLRNTFSKQARILDKGLRDHILTDNLILSYFGSQVLQDLADEIGWPRIRGGSDALISSLEEAILNQGIQVVLNRRVQSLEELPEASLTVFATGSGPAGKILGKQFDESANLVAVEKKDYLLNSPVPWGEAGEFAGSTVHLGGDYSDPRYTWGVFYEGTIFDPPSQGMFYASGYRRVNASGETAAIEDEIEKYAPGFKSTIKETVVTRSREFERVNPSIIEADILQGKLSFERMLIAESKFLQSGKIIIAGSQLFPGPGAHGLVGYRVARRAQRILSSAQRKFPKNQ